MLKIAITGNIGSGKSEVEKILIKKGYKVLDTDKVAHKILQSNSKIKETFKNYDVFENNQISRQKLGELIFNNDNLKTKLENIVHPEVKSAITQFFADNKNENKLFVSIPLLFECGMEKMFDKILCVCTDTSICLKRIIQRNNWTKEYAQKRIESQLSQNIKMQKSDYIIKNNGTIADLETQTEQFLKQV